MSKLKNLTKNDTGAYHAPKCMQMSVNLHTPLLSMSIEGLRKDDDDIDAFGEE